MRKPVKKAVRRLPTSSKPKPRSAVSRAAQAIARKRGQPASDEAILDPGTVIREHIRSIRGRRAGGQSTRKDAVRTAFTKELMRETANDPEDKPPTVDELHRARMAELGATGRRTAAKSPKK